MFGIIILYNDIILAKGQMMQNLNFQCSIVCKNRETIDQTGLELVASTRVIETSNQNPHICQLQIYILHYTVVGAPIFNWKGTILAIFIKIV